MRTEKQISASRKNAKKSTGPRTTEGKTNSSKNALKHGLMAQDAVIPGEDPAAFDRHLTNVENTYLPRNYVEKQIVHQIADTMWRIKRLSRIETTVMSASIERTRVYQHDYRVERIRQGHEGDLQLLGESMFGGTKFLNNLARYDGHLRRCLHRDLELMMKIRREERKSREAQAAADDSTAYRDPSHRNRGVDGSPRFAGPTARPEARGKPDKCHDRTPTMESETDQTKPRAPLGFRAASPQNEKPQNEAEPDLTPTGTTAYEATRAIASPPTLRDAGPKETCGRNLQL